MMVNQLKQGQLLVGKGFLPYFGTSIPLVTPYLTRKFQPRDSIFQP